MAAISATVMEARRASGVFRLVTPSLWRSGYGSLDTHALQSRRRGEKCLLFQGGSFPSLLMACIRC